MEMKHWCSSYVCEASSLLILWKTTTVQSYSDFFSRSPRNRLSICCRFDVVSKLLPESYHKQLANVKKIQDRKKRDAVAEKHSKSRGRDTGVDGNDSTLLQSVKKSQPERYDTLHFSLSFAADVL